MPIHPSIVHIPIVTAFLLPALIAIVAWYINERKVTNRAWFVIVALQVLITGLGYLSLETGETEEEAVSRVLEKSLINQHEEAAEMFVGFSVITLVLGITAIFLRRNHQLPLHIVVGILSLVSASMAFRAGKLGGELVYIHGAASAYTDATPQGILPTPGLNTSESPLPVNENESLKTDDNDYGNPDSPQTEDD